MANLPRLLEEGRVEVRLVDKGTHVLDLVQIDILMDHLQSAKNLLAPKACIPGKALRKRTAHIGG